LLDVALSLRIWAFQSIPNPDSSFLYPFVHGHFSFFT
jgi:hypothetical protein